MSRTILIIGGTKKERKERAESYFPNPTPHPDFLTITQSITIGINQVREIQHFVGLRPYSANFKVAYVEEAQNLTIEAQNAFLKTLEEPPSRTIIILAAPSVDNLLPTIVSRCQLANIKSATDKDSNNDATKLKEFLPLVAKPLGENFAYVASSLSSRDLAEKWLEDNQVLLFRSFHESQKKVNSQFPSANLQYVALQQALEKAKKRISRNVNPRFVLENFFIEVKAILP